ncbi:hypothetical protein J3A83DRAFT_4401887 [Scleroderma citrinum]
MPVSNEGMGEANFFRMHLRAANGVKLIRSLPPNAPSLPSITQKRTYNKAVKSNHRALKDDEETSQSRRATVWKQVKLHPEIDRWGIMKNHLAATASIMLLRLLQSVLSMTAFVQSDGPENGAGSRTVYQYSSEAPAPDDQAVSLASYITGVNSSDSHGPDLGTLDPMITCGCDPSAVDWQMATRRQLMLNISGSQGSRGRWRFDKQEGSSLHLK